MKLIYFLICISLAVISCSEKSRSIASEDEPVEVTLPVQKDYAEAYKHLVRDTRRYEYSKNKLYKDLDVVRQADYSERPPFRSNMDHCYDLFKLLKNNGQELKAAKGPNADDTFYEDNLKPHLNRVVLHYTEGPASSSLKGIQKYHQEKGWGNSGYHFLAKQSKDGKNCTIYEGRPLHKVPIAAGAVPSRNQQCYESGDKNFEMNHDFDLGSVNIAWVGHNSTETSSACEKKLKTFISKLKKRLGINKIGGHGHYKNTHTSCPGDHMASFLENTYGGPDSDMVLEGSGREGSPNNIYSSLVEANPDKKANAITWRTQSVGKYQSQIADLKSIATDLDIQIARGANSSPAVIAFYKKQLAKTQRQIDKLYKAIENLSNNPLSLNGRDLNRNFCNGMPYSQWAEMRKKGLKIPPRTFVYNDISNLKLNCDACGRRSKSSSGKAWRNNCAK